MTVDKQDIYVGAIQVAQVMCEKINPTNFSTKDINNAEYASKVAKFALDIAVKIAQGLDDVEETG